MHIYIYIYIYDTYITRIRMKKIKKSYIIENASPYVYIGQTLAKTLNCEKKRPALIFFFFFFLVWVAFNNTSFLCLVRGWWVYHKYLNKFKQGLQKQ